MLPRLQSGASVRPLNFTVRHLGAVLLQVRHLFLAMVVCATVQAADTTAPQSLTAAIYKFLSLGGDASTPRFEFALTDLNGDGIDDAVVLLTDRRHCGSGGCTLLIFKGVDSGFSLVSSSTITLLPIRVAAESSHGWKTLIVDSGGAGTVALRYNGSRYPSNPSLQEKASLRQISASKVVLALQETVPNQRLERP